MGMEFLPVFFSKLIHGARLISPQKKSVQVIRKDELRVVRTSDSVEVKVQEGVRPPSRAALMRAFDASEDELGEAAVTLASRVRGSRKRT